MISGLSISPKKVAVAMGFIVLIIVILSLGGQYFREAFGDDELALKVISKLNLDEERNNLPTWYQSSTLLISSIVLLVIGMARRELADKDAKYWWLLSLIFLFLSLDEAVSIHEQLTMPLRTAFDLEGIFFLSWVIPAALIVVILAGVFAKFLFRLPDRTRNLMIASAAVFLLGAVGMEMVGANYMYLMNDPPEISTDFRYVVITTIEELLEMIGVAIFIFSLLNYLVNPAPELREKSESVVKPNSENANLSVSGSF